jgi:uncharacterized protein involved in tolerance to divalent cations
MSAIAVSMTCSEVRHSIDSHHAYTVPDIQARDTL